MRRIACLQNYAIEGPGLIERWAEERGHEIVCFLASDGEFPATSEFDALVVMGGPMSVHDYSESPAVAKAIETVAAFTKAGQPIFGVCLGAQMLAIATGGDVVPGDQKEIGWFPLSAEGSSGIIRDGLPVLHWHGERIIAPDSAITFASTPVCPVQAFSLSPHQIGLQFHFEATPKTIRDFISGFEDELEEGGATVQSAEAIREGLDTYGPECQQALFEILDRWEAHFPK